MDKMKAHDQASFAALREMRNKGADWMGEYDCVQRARSAAEEALRPQYPTTYRRIAQAIIVRLTLSEDP